MGKEATCNCFRSKGKEGRDSHTRPFGCSLISMLSRPVTHVTQAHATVNACHMLPPHNLTDTPAYNLIARSKGPQVQAAEKHAGAWVWSIDGCERQFCN